MRSDPPGDGDIRLYHCPFQQLEEVAGIEPNSVNLILTDIPYGKDFLPQVADLGAFAARVFVEGGLLVTYSGQYHLDHVMRTLDEHLTYRWIKCSQIRNDANLVHPYQILSFWKPILIYSKGAWLERRQWHDVCRAAEKEKDWHDWQQPLEEVERLIQDLASERSGHRSPWRWLYNCGRLQEPWSPLHLLRHRRGGAYRRTRPA